jgi:hypothetical protein
LARGISAGLTTSEGRKFGLLVGGAFLLLGALLWRRGWVVGAWIPAALGGMLLLAGLTIPTRLGPVYRGWMAFALVISKVTTPLFMGLIYFLVLTPSGLIARLFGHRPLEHTQGVANYWQSRPAGTGRGKMEHQF